MTNEQYHAVQEMSRAGFRILIICFVLIILLAVVGTLFQHFLAVDDGLFHDAMRLIGIGGPTGTASNAAADAVKTWRASATPEATPALANQPWKDGNGM